MEQRTSLAVRRGSIDQAELRTEELGPLAPGKVRLRVDHVALTANTVTYAQFGDALAYWDFYPLDETWGHVPAIGWATVVESAVDDAEVGTHLHGWFPMATTVDVEVQARPDGLRDVGPHRAAHAATYRAFLVDEAARADAERFSLLRGLYATGHLIQTFLADARFGSVEQSVVLSASSKTAIGYAFAARRASAPQPAMIGVTSARNVDFVRRLDLYDEVTTYDDLAELSRRPSTVVDMAGAGQAVAAIHDRLRDLIAHSMLVGKSHHDAAPAPIQAGPDPELFFAPSEIDRRAAELGPEAFRDELSTAITDFVADSHRWLDLEHHAGPEPFRAAWDRVLSGAVAPSVGMIATMHAD